MKRPATPSTPTLTPAARLADALAALELALVELADALDEEADDDADEVEFVALEVPLLHDAVAGFSRHQLSVRHIGTQMSVHVPMLRRQVHRSVGRTAGLESGSAGRMI